MSRERTQYRCRECGAVAPRWAGRCPPCGAWNTLEEEVRPTGSAAPAAGRPGAPRRAAPVPLAAVTGTGPSVHPTHLPELDRVLGGGLVEQSVTLIAGEPGIGKSTLLLQMLGAMAAGGLRTLLVSAEESPEQVGIRAARLGLAADTLWVAGQTELRAIREAVAEVRPDVLVVDSIQTVSDTDSGAAAGSVTSVRGCAAALADDAKSGGPATVLVGHVTKDGSIAGPRVLEHLVDTVLSFEGDRHHSLRVLRAVKHRFGPVGELGMWEMAAGGLEEVPDGGALLLADRRPEAPGSVVFAAMEGRRPLLVEIQALVAPSAGAPRRSASGYDGGRLSQLVAVLDQRAGLDLRQSDVYVSVVGGVRISDPGADLAVAAAITSAVSDRAVPDDVVVVGEVGLGGEIRQVAGTALRLAESRRLGFTGALAPPSPPEVPGLAVVPVAFLAEGLDRLLAGRPVRSPRLRVLDGRSAVGSGPGG